MRKRKKKDEWKARGPTQRTPVSRVAALNPCLTFLLHSLHLNLLTASWMRKWRVRLLLRVKRLLHREQL